MGCERLRELTDEYLDGTLTGELKKEMEEHLTICSHCTKYIEEQGKILGILSDLEEDELPPGFKQRLQDRLQQAANQDKSKLKTIWSEKPWLKWSAAIAAVFVVAFSVYLTQPFKVTRESPAEEARDFQMHSADRNAAKYDAAQSEEFFGLDQEDTTSLVDEADPAEEILGAAELPTEIFLYVSKDSGISNEDVQSEIVSIANEFQLDILKKEYNKVILQKNDKIQSDILFERLSQLGRMELSSWKVRENTLTIQIINE